MTIVNICSSVKFYAHVRIKAGALRLLKKTVAAHCSPNPGDKTLFGLFECYLDLRSEEVTAKTLRSPESDTLLAGFVGALRSAEFVAVRTPITRAGYVFTFRRILIALQCKHSTGQVMNNDKCDAIWSAVQVNATAATYWQGWQASPHSGHALHLHWVWRIFGSESCTATHAALTTYWAGRKNSVKNSVSLFNQFFSFVAKHEPTTSANTLSDHGRLEQLIRKFCRHYFVAADQKNLDIGVARKRWNNWRNAIEEALFKSQTWARVDIPYAGPGKNSALNWLKHDKNGRPVKTKFLVRIPIEVSDQSAINYLIQEVNDSVETVVAWCTHLRSETIATRSHIQTLARSGTDLLENGRIVGNERNVSLADLAATYLKHGIGMFQPKAHFVGVKNFTAAEAAEVLAIPVWNTLDPLLYLLINEHQEITSSFLESIEVCDESLKEKCIRRTDAGYVLVGYKGRRGATLSEQTIPLNDRSLEIVRNLISLTTPLRDWMRIKDIPTWNRLLLSCGRGLSAPGVMVRASENTKPLARANLKASIAPFYKGDPENIDLFSSKISLATVRATKALSLYFNDGDEIAFAHRLGHKQYRPNLMDHYLPKAFRNYMKSRTILTTQTLIVAEAMKDSPLQLPATGFTTIEQLGIFLSNHKLHDLAKSSSEADVQRSRSRILINIDQEILGQLAALEFASNQAGFKLKEDLVQWIDFSRMLFAEGRRQQHDSKLQAKIIAAEKAGRTAHYLNLVRV